jgi:hypothetical protein
VIDAIVMKLLASVSFFSLKVSLALVAFSYTAIQFPVTTRDLMVSVNRIGEYIACQIPQAYIPWVRILFWPNLIIFVGFTVAVHIVTDLAYRALFRKRQLMKRPSITSSEKEVIDRWG